MSIVLGLLSTVALVALPPLPDRGLARETKAGVQLQTMSGRPLATVPGLDLAPDKATGHRLVLRDRRGRLYSLDRDARRVRRVSERRARFRGCRLTDVRAGFELHVCGRTITTAPISGSHRIDVLGPAGGGHWVWAEFAPRGNGVLAQWSAECEVPVAYLIADGKLRSYAPESVALGWLPGGAALIHFPNGPCGGGSMHPRGIYAVPRVGKPRLILRTPRFAQYWMWGG
jgi:hypothetical protein